MMNLEKLLVFLNGYDDKVIVSKLSYLNRSCNKSENIAIKVCNRSRSLFILKAHEALAQKSGLERYGLQNTINKLEAMDVENITLALFRDDSYHAEFYFDVCCSGLISIVLIKSRKKPRWKLKRSLSVLIKIDNRDDG
ncbi:hypothetical protein [Phytobacter massiliensis]|uniref:hypothetical protein n=1 Tax=Phytobacter massiliensis TaxID=1485952 RepID=UPI0005C67753|nr:hypothetical protein [Phytobacter massiliensis]